MSVLIIGNSTHCNVCAGTYTGYCVLPQPQILHGSLSSGSVAGVGSLAGKMKSPNTNFLHLIPTIIISCMVRKSYCGCLTWTVVLHKHSDPSLTLSWKSPIMALSLRCWQCAAVIAQTWLTKTPPQKWVQPRPPWGSLPKNPREIIYGSSPRTPSVPLMIRLEPKASSLFFSTQDLASPSLLGVKSFLPAPRHLHLTPLQEHSSKLFFATAGRKTWPSLQLIPQAAPSVHWGKGPFSSIEHSSSPRLESVQR